MPKQYLLEQILKKHNIGLAYLFGSQALKGLSVLQGNSLKNDDPLTDLDLGIVFIDRLPDISRRRKVYASLYDAIGDIFDPFRLDLVFLQENHAVFQANAISGCCIYEVNKQFRFDYEEDVLRRAADFRPFLERYLDEYLEEVTAIGRQTGC